jgi:virulence-associated protein VapD
MKKKKNQFHWIKKSIESIRRLGLSIDVDALLGEKAIIIIKILNSIQV